MNIIEFIRDPAMIAGELSEYQETALRLLYGLELSADQQTIARLLLDAEFLPGAREYFEATAIWGRRSGKTDRFAANIAVYEAALGGHERVLTRGERGHIVLISQDKRAARVSYRYILAKLENSPMLRELIAAIRGEEIDLVNNLTISIFPCSFRATRGFSIPVAILDEIAFFRAEGVNVDKEVVDAIRPAQATFPRSKLIKISSPYAKAGELFRDYANRHNRPELLCMQSASWLMNPSIPQNFLDSERDRDPEYFEREYEAKFTDSISSAFSREAVIGCVSPNRFELPYVEEFRYFAGVDPAAGGADEFTVSICHMEKDRVVQDVIRGWRSKRPQDVVLEQVTILKAFRVNRITGDKYTGEWVRTAFRDAGIQYDVADLTASEAFLELLPRVNQGSIELLDDKRQTAQLIALERHKGKTGKDTLSHPTGGHDDRPNALALAMVQAVRAATTCTWGPIEMEWGADDRKLENGEVFYEEERIGGGVGPWGI